MPLYSNAERVIRENLAAASQGIKPKTVTIGELSPMQLQTWNAVRAKNNLLAVDGTIFFRGTHIYQSRIVRDGYSVDDVVLQIKSAFAETSVIKWTPKMTALQSVMPRHDGYGNLVRDEIALEAMSRFPRSELFSIIPKGDKIKPPRNQAPHS